MCFRTEEWKLWTNFISQVTGIAININLVMNIVVHHKEGPSESLL